MIGRSSAAIALAVAFGLLAPGTITDREPDPLPRETIAIPFVVEHHPPHVLAIPSLQIQAFVKAVGMADEVTMEIPEDIQQVGWFQYSARPGRLTGTMVLVGHRDGTSDPNGVFRNLRDLQEGAVILVQDAAEQQSHYRVIDVALVDKFAFAALAPSIFAADGEHRLVLLTCGGTYDRSRGGYQANVVVTAMPS